MEALSRQSVSQSRRCQGGSVKSRPMNQPGTTARGPHAEGPTPRPFSALLGFRYVSVDEVESVVEADPGPSTATGAESCTGVSLPPSSTRPPGGPCTRACLRGRLHRTCTSASSTSWRRYRGRRSPAEPDVSSIAGADRLDRGRAHPAWGGGGPGRRYSRRPGSLRPRVRGTRTRRSSSGARCVPEPLRYQPAGMASISLSRPSRSLEIGFDRWVSGSTIEPVRWFR